MKKQLCLAACIVAVLAFTAACGDSSASTSTENNTQSADTEADTEEAATDSLSARKSVSDDVPEMDFDGAEYRIFYQKRYTTDAVPEADEETGDLVNDAVYERNRTVEERFNVKIVGIEGEEEAMVKTLMSSVAAGDDAYELFMGHGIYSSKAALGGYFYDLYDIPYLDFSKPWYPQFAVSGLTLNGHMYMGVSDMCLSVVSNVYCIYFNKQLAADYDLPDIYSLVENGEWTLDKFSELTKDFYVDLNGDGKKDESDLFGFSSPINNATAIWPLACDVPTVEFGDDGIVTSVFNSERASTMLEKLRSIYLTNDGSLCGDTIDSEADFENGTVLFLADSVMQSASAFRDVDFDYGIIPNPKFDESQDTYYTIPGGSVSVIAVPASAQNLELVGAVMEALNRESWVSVLPTYYDVALKVKGVRDETSIEMLDLIMDGRKVNAEFLYDGFSGYIYKMPTLINSNKEIASFCASNDKAVLKHYQEVYDFFMGVDG